MWFIRITCVTTSSFQEQYNFCYDAAVEYVRSSDICTSTNAAQAPMPVNFAPQEEVEVGPPPQLAMSPSQDHQRISLYGTANSAVALGHTSMVGVMPPAPLVHSTQTLLHSLAVSMATLEASCCPRKIQTSVIQQLQISVPIVQKPSFSTHWPSCIGVMYFVLCMQTNTH